MIAYCEKRSDLSDWSCYSIVERFSDDGGVTWSEVSDIVKGDKQFPLNNPVMITDDHVIHLLYEVKYGLPGGGIYYSKSNDNGLTWSHPKEILSKYRHIYNVFATGPGHGIMTKSGRIIVPVWMVKTNENIDVKSHHPGTVATIFSDDHGETWSLGEEVPAGEIDDPNESAIVQLKDGSFLINIRNKGKYRAVSRSNTGINDWSEMVHDYALKDPICFGSMISIDGKDIIFVNCDSETERGNLSAKLSRDQGETWEKIWFVKDGGYADITTDNKFIYVLGEYQKGKDKDALFSIDLYKLKRELIQRK